MFDEDARTYALIGGQPNAEKTMSTLKRMLCLNELNKYRVVIASKETINAIKGKADKSSLENIVFVAAPVDGEKIYVVNDAMMKYRILSDKEIIQKSPELEAIEVIYGGRRGSGKSPFSFYDIKEE